MHKQQNINEKTCQCGNPYSIEKLQVAIGFHMNAGTDTTHSIVIGLSFYNKLMTWK